MIKHHTQVYTWYSVIIPRKYKAWFQFRIVKRYQPLKSNLGVWYRIVSTSSFCGHVLGGKPYHCLRNKEPDCQKQCTLSEWCIGYARRHNSCALMTSSGVCPSTWEKMSGNVARSEGDLVATYSDDWVCKSKKGIKSMK